MDFSTTIRLLTLCTLIALSSCDSKTSSPNTAKKYANTAVDANSKLLIRGGPIYTVNNESQIAEAVLVKGDKIELVGSFKDSEQWIDDNTNIIDLDGRAMTPGFIDSHVHIFSVGWAKKNVDLNGAKNYEEVIERVVDAAEDAEPGQWILGRGWHQSKWDPQPRLVKGFQTHHALSKAVPDHPVYLTHASGHAGLANAKAMEIAKVTRRTKFEDGGEIIKDENGDPTGIFNEAAQRLITHYTENTSLDAERDALLLGIEEAFKHGLTSIQNAGVSMNQLKVLYILANKNELPIRTYAMLDGNSESQLRYWYEKGPHITDYLTIRSVKFYADGALGSRGAWLLEPYHDRDNHYGMPVNPMEFLRISTERALENGFQVATHAIGDRGNREILDIYENAFRKFPDAAKDPRFRIEHAQHINPEDIPRFAKLGVIASMQTIHLSSDRPWAIDRLGLNRIEDGAYVWQKLLQSGAIVANGTDAPVEPINTIENFYASVTRKTLAGHPDSGYEASQKMSRAQALRSYTRDAAYAAFEENTKGTIEAGRLADFTIFSQDIMTIEEDKILDTKIDYTIIGGRVVYER